MVSLSCDKRARILGLRYPSSGTPTSISAIARATGHDRKTIRKTLKRVEQTSTLQHDLPHPGRPRILTPRDINHLKLALARGEVANATDAQRLLAPQASARTRRTWAQEVGDWDMDWWRLIVFSDESKFNLFGSDGRQWCWRRVGGEFLDRNVKKRVAGGGGSVMVWGCITSKGVGQLHWINGIMDAKKYCSILEESLLGTLSDKHLSPRSVIFQQDNDRKHTSKLAQSWFAEHKILLLPLALLLS
ncbi:hypothetical protein VTO73DRAFT_14458 [Trametes versicolor]